MTRSSSVGAVVPFRTVEVLIDVDGPVLFLAEDEIGTRYVASLVDEDEMMAEYAFIPIEPHIEEDLSQGRMSLRKAVIQAGGLWHVVTTLPDSGLDGSVQWFPLGEVADRMMPARTAYLTLLGARSDEFQQSDLRPTGEAFALSFEPTDVNALEAVQIRTAGVDAWQAPLHLTAEERARFIERLANMWKFLWLDEGLPSSFYHSSIQELYAQADINQNNAPSNRLKELLATHDLAATFPDSTIPSIVLLPQGSFVWVITDSTAQRLQLNVVLQQVEAEVGEMLARLPGGKREWSHVRSTWLERWSANDFELAALVSRRSVQALKKLESGLSQGGLKQTGDPLRSEVFAAARMTQSVSIDRAGAVFEALQALPRRSSVVVDYFSRWAGGELELKGRPFEQGWAAAEWFRTVLGFAVDETLHPDAILRELGVPVVRITSDANLDAVAAWGPRYGPAVALNANGRRAANRAGERATLAHEIGHLLLDRDGGLPLIEVLGVGAPRALESRANAFAAEFLLPRATAGLAYRQMQGNVEQLVAELIQQFLVSRELAAWQVRNSDVTLAEQDRAALGRMVQPGRQY